jgi:hypothetical protein
MGELKSWTIALEGSGRAVSIVMYGKPECFELNFEREELTFEENRIDRTRRSEIFDRRSR